MFSLKLNSFTSLKVQATWIIHGILKAHPCALLHAFFGLTDFFFTYFFLLQFQNTNSNTWLASFSLKSPSSMSSSVDLHSQNLGQITIRFFHDELKKSDAMNITHTLLVELWIVWFFWWHHFSYGRCNKINWWLLGNWLEEKKEINFFKNKVSSMGG